VRDRRAQQIDRVVAGGREDAHLAHRHGGHARRGHIGHASVGVLQARVDDVGFAGQERGALGAHVDRIAAHQQRQQVQVVNHQIHHHRNVGSAGRERRQPVHLDEHRFANPGQHRLQRAVKPLDVPDLQHAPRFPRGAHDRLAVGHGGRDGFFDEEIAPRCDGLHRDVVVGGGAGDDADRIDVGQQRGEAGIELRAKLVGGRACARRVNVETPDVRHPGQRA
jgi:hypothetical protein